MNLPPRTRESERAPDRLGAKVLNETQGFYAKQDYIAQFERDLFKQGKLDAFKAIYAEESGVSWEDHLDDIDTIENDTFARAYAKFFNKSEDEGLRFFDRLREKYRLSVEAFGERLADYLKTLPIGARINFFVDEVGQFIGRRSKLMLNLQTIAETLATKCDGRAWIFVTSQGNIETVMVSWRTPGGTTSSSMPRSSCTSSTCSRSVLSSCPSTMPLPGSMPPPYPDHAC